MSLRTKLLLITLLPMIAMSAAMAAIITFQSERLSRAQVEAANDHVVGTTGKKQVTVIVQIARVPGREPALVVEHAAGLVFARNLWPSHENLARFPRAEPLALLVANLDFN